MDDNKDNIIKYYSSIDNNLLDDLCKNSNIKNLINLSTYSDINVFNKKKNKYHLKTKNKLLKECENIKKKSLLNLAKLNDNKIENKIENINKLIICLNNLDKEKYKYIECYSND